MGMSTPSSHLAVLLLIILSAESVHTSSLRPKLEMAVSYENITAQMDPGASFAYKVTLKHTSDSTADAQGVQILLMLTPFVKFKELKSFKIQKPTHAQKDDSVVFKFKEVIWSSEPSFELTVTFDEENQLNGPGKHHVITHAQITYYDTYVEDAQGVVTRKGTFYSEPLKTMEFETEIPGCTAPLGMKSKEIQDYQLSASSSYSEAQPSQARETDDGWCAKSTTGEQYLQVEFLQQTRVTGLATIRRQSKPHWITEYFVTYSSDGTNWRTYTENGFKKLFLGNTISLTLTKHWLANPFDALSIRILPTKWKSLICLRLEVYGCPFKGSANNCISPLGMESGEIPDEALSDLRASISPSDKNQPKNARLNVEVTDYPYGWESTTKTKYLEVDFGSLRRVTKVAVQGAYTTDSSTQFYVKTYKLSYSKNKIDWTEYSEKGSLKIFQGPATNYDAKYPVVEVILSPFVARYVRFHPLDAGTGGVKVMRAELYGCFQEPVPPYTGASDVTYHRRSFIVDPTTDQFYVCMYTNDRAESSCFSTKDSKAWTAIDANIIGMLAANSRDQEIYALDRQMNIYRSRDSGASWFQISREYYFNVVKETTTHQAKGITENFVSSLPTTNTTVVSSKGEKWGVSSSNIHFMAAGSSAWSTVGSWKCCGM